MESPQSDTFRTRDAESPSLHALHWGDPSAPTLVLLHGGGANAHWWDHLAPSWSDRFHVVALDFRGHGDSERPETLRPGAFNDDLEALLEDLGKRDVFLIGHSMGAGVALDHAARHHEIRGLILLDLARGGARRSRRAARLALALRRTYATREEAIDRYRFFPPAEHADETLRLAIAHRSVGREPDGRYAFKFDPRWFTLPPRERPDPADVRCPALLVRGAESGLLSPEGAERWLEELPGARLAEIPGAGHHVQLDRPDAVIEVAGRFLDSLLGAASD